MQKISTVYPKTHKGYFTSLCPGAVVTYRKINSHLIKIGVVLERGNAYIPGGRRNPIRKTTLLTGIILKQNFVKVVSMSNDIEFIQSQYARVIIPPSAMQAYFTFDDLKEIADALGVSHPTTASLMSQVMHPRDEDSKDKAIEEGKRFMKYLSGLPATKTSRVSTKNYFSGSDS